MEPRKKPLNLLMREVKSEIRVKLKNNSEYRGKMAQCDGYMNIILEEAVELHGDEPVAKYGNIFIRGNNILYICLGEGWK